MKNILDWKNTELDGLPNAGEIILAVGDGFSRYAIARLSRYSDYFVVQPFCSNVLYLPPQQIKLWAYLPDKENENYKYARETFQIRYKENGVWEDVPHKEITSHNTAVKAMEQLKNSIAFEDVELMIERKLSLKSELEFDLYKDYHR